MRLGGIDLNETNDRNDVDLYAHKFKFPYDEHEKIQFIAPHFIFLKGNLDIKAWTNLVMIMRW